MKTMTAKELAIAVRRAIRLNGHSGDYCRTVPASYASRRQPTTKTARLACVRAQIKVPRGRGPMVDLLCERLPYPQAEPQPLQARLLERLADLYRREIRRRGGETEIGDKDRDIELTIADRAGGLSVLHCSGWRYYSSRAGSWRASLSYLCGTDDNGRWAVRVPGTATTVADAVDFVEPREVRDARAAGRKVLRQGDVYAVETTRAHDGKGRLPARHQWDPQARTLTHDDPDRPHAPLHVDYPVRFVQQSVYRMGRQARRGGGD